MGMLSVEQKGSHSSLEETHGQKECHVESLQKMEKAGNTWFLGDRVHCYRLPLSPEWAVENLRKHFSRELGPMSLFLLGLRVIECDLGDCCYGV